MNEYEYFNFDYKSTFESFWQTENLTEFLLSELKEMDLTDFLMYELKDMNYEICKVNKQVFRYDNIEYYIKTRLIDTSDIKSAINQIIKQFKNYNTIFLYEFKIIKKEIEEKEFTFNFIVRYEGIYNKKEN